VTVYNITEKDIKKERKKKGICRRKTEREREKGRERKRERERERG